MVDANDYPRVPIELEIGGLENVCKWSKESKEACPHKMTDLSQKGKIANSVIECIGNTPMIRLNNIPKKDGIECEVLVKCEFLNPGGSVKDRIGRRMVLDAQESGLIKPGDVLIEPTSGNTGIGIASVAAQLGYRCIIVMLEKMSQEKQDALRGLGAEIVRTPTEYAFNHRDGIMGTAHKLKDAILATGKNAVILD